jgi:hypothetical protein
MKRGGVGYISKGMEGRKKKISDLKIRSGLILFFSSGGLYREEGGGGQVDFFILI